MKQPTISFRSAALAISLMIGTLSLGVGCTDEVVLEPSIPGAKKAPKPPSAPPPSTSDGPTIFDTRLAVRTVIGDLAAPIGMAFLGADDFLFLERLTGRVRRVTSGVLLPDPVLDLPVNSGGSHGLLSIALHPAFAANDWIYLFWTESSTGADTPNREQTPLLGNRVDRYIWNGSTLTFDRTVARVRALEWDQSQTVWSNHDGGVLRFGPDGKLYVFVGDVGRRGALQNLRCGPTNVYNCPPGTPVSDDAHGGPEPDDAHLTGVILRLNDDGTPPSDNPFYTLGAGLGGEIGANVQSIFSYGHRNSFGMAFDPKSGHLWLQENGDDSFSEINLVAPGMNGGWIQIMGPAARVAEFKHIETTMYDFGLRRPAWSPANIADTPGEALARLYELAGSSYVDPQLSWKYDVAPGGMEFIDGTALGNGYDGDLILGAGLPVLYGGYLFRLPLTANRTSLHLSDARLGDGVADNVTKHEITESESLLFGANFGVVTDIRNAPSGNLYVVSLSARAIYEIYQAPAAPVATFTYSCTAFNCTFDGSSSTPTGGIASYNWVASDGQSSSGPSPHAQFSFSARTNVTVTLEVRDAADQKASTGKTVRCNPHQCR